MQLVNMDVERHGSRDSLSFGPLSPGLNALYGPVGAGKTTLLKWLRQIAHEDRQTGASASEVIGQPRSPMVGSVEVDNRGLRFRLSNQRLAAQTHSPYEAAHRAWPAELLQANLTFGQREAFGSLASVTGANDTEAELERIAQRLGLDSPSIVNQPPEREQLLARQREVEARLQPLQRLNLNTSREALLLRRDELQRDLHATRSGVRGAHPPGHVNFDGQTNEQQRYEDRFRLVEADLRNTEMRLAKLDSELASLHAESKALETSRHSFTVDDSYRVQLQQIDERLTRWRQTLRDLKGHRNHIEHEATDARLDRQVGDQLSATKEPDPRAPLRSLEAQILSARNQLDALVDRYSIFQDRHHMSDRVGPGEHRGGASRRGDYTVHQDSYGRTHIAYIDGYHYPDSSNLPDTLRSMQKDLYEACQQLARHESRAAAEMLKQQTQQLQRCEAELLHSVEKLIEERATLLRKIADQYQLSADQMSLAFGDWCDCHDHNHLHDWLLSESEVKTSHVGSDPQARQRLLARIESVEIERKRANDHAEDCRRQMRDAELYRVDLGDLRSQSRGRLVDEMQRELAELLAHLDQWEERERLQREADELRHRLATLRQIPSTDSRFRDLVHRHIAGLMGGPERLGSKAYRQAPERMQRRYDLVDGIVYDQERRFDAEVPAALVRVAHRLAIVEAMSARGEPIPLLLDDALDGLTHDDQAIAIDYLAQVATAGQQIVVLTATARVAELVRQQRGWVGYLNASTPPAVDINRHLTAVANDYEAAKWYQPNIHAEPLRSSESRGPYYLTERSRVEESPSIDGVLSDRLRAIGIDRVGDLLDVDPRWLAEQLRQDGVTEATVASWQAEARLLCSVRQLRPFDARLLVSIGIRSPQQLAEMHPSQLLDRVERFVATDRGRRLLRSGSSYELSRITTWIASAKGGAGRFQRSSFADRGESNFGRDSIASDRDQVRASRAEQNGSHRNDLARNTWTQSDDRRNDFVFDHEGGYNHEAERDSERRRSAAADATLLTQDKRSYEDDFDRERRDHAARPVSRRERRSNPSSRTEPSRPGNPRSPERGSGEYPSLKRSDRSRTNGERELGAVRPTRSRRERDLRQPRRAEAIKLADAQYLPDDNVRLKFYLELASPVVDAPSIGARMASRLEKFGMHTVDQLLAANAETLADKLNLRRIDATTIRSWQEQARLVCRIPNLRAHDAQLLVACNLTSPEELAAMQAANVLSQVLMVAESSEGQRILRGSKQPDLAEVNDWIDWAGQCRSLSAA